MHLYAKSHQLALLDTNLLAVLLVGQLGVGYIEKNKKTRNYISDDFDLLVKLLGNFKDIITTPHILAEITNLIDWVTGKHRDILFIYLKKFIEQKQEIYLPAENIIKNSLFNQLGLSDTGMIEVAKTNNLVIITSDLDLYNHSISQNLKAINFNHIRNGAYQ